MPSPAPSLRDRHESDKTFRARCPDTSDRMSARPILFIEQSASVSFPLDQHSDTCRTESVNVASPKSKIRTETQYIEGLSLNKSNTDLRINFLQHHEFDCCDHEV